MPVLSPHRSTASALTGSYRTTFSSTSSERPYFTSSPRISSYSERYRSYTDTDGRRVFSRSGSITEDGVTQRYREESRESSVNRSDSYSLSRRESSLSRDTSTTSSRLSSTNVIDSVADLRNRYSPANYVPACLREQRNNDNLITRSKSINDIGLPPIESKLNNKKSKVNELNLNNTSKNCLLAVAYPNNPTKNDNTMSDCVDFDNNNRASVADLRKKFDQINNRGGSKAIGKKLASSGELSKSDCVVIGGKFDVKSTANHQANFDELTNGESGAISELLRRSSGARINNFASYIPAKGYPEKEEPPIEPKNEISTNSSKLSARASPASNSSSSSISAAGSLKRSAERERSFGHENNEANISGHGKQHGLNGLKNIGNTCFMNSVIQCLSNTRNLNDYLLKDGHVNDINSNTSNMKGALIKSFVEVIKELWSEDASDRVVNTASLKSQIQRFAPRFIGYAQQDAQEFLRYLLEGLHEDVNRVKERPKPILTEIDEKMSDSEKSQESWNRYLRMDNSRIVDLFVGQLKSTLKCTHCGHCSVTFDPFWDLSLPIPQRAGQIRLSQCLESFTREETLDGDEKPTCSKCKERRRCTKSFSIQKFPKILVIHLKRFSLAERFRGKLNCTVDFPLEGLDLSNYAAEQGTSCRYNLYAVSNHSGTTYSGHYTAYCRHPYSKTWHEYNDSRVSPISAKSIVSGEAYVLFYEQDGQKSHL